MPSATATYAYRDSSAFDAAVRALALQTSGGRTPAGDAAHPRFFDGNLTEPGASAAALLAVADVAAARYYDPRRTGSASLDPVVTAGGGGLRFESFSGCCGVHARLDVPPAGLDGGDVGRGTTNVDVNLPLRDALGRLTGGEPLGLTVGPDALAVRTGGGRIVEKKVPLPDRWIRGFAETPLLTSRFDLRAEVTAAETLRFLRTLPRAGAGNAARGAEWVVAHGGRLRSTSRPAPGAVCLPGPQRLTALRRVLRHARGLRLYGPPVTARSGTQAAAWEISLAAGLRLTLTLSPETGRGFSGEGAVLDDLAGPDVEADAELLSVLLAWDSQIDTAGLAAEAGLTVERTRAALTRLGVDGRVGYDAATAAYFHRELPFVPGRAEDHNPRLRTARAIVAAGGVRRLGPGLAEVTTTDGRTHRVRADAGTTRAASACTCQWWAEHRGRRGPCSHALAVRIAPDDSVTGANTPDNTEAGHGR
ncbi:SWIM zinc finger domain-containing protein [Streptomyces sp. WMMC500]|uniref:SWIM zinc finger family protein n=1 Tax=Streptomyces sp. WMMC500 TaxID=3015154 RepID=UPI00248B3924|nr:SWIM zinc finger family protein [Streptomyces sp. WMMC500]WBB62093.1 SWIM zinc finger domain-containing protein [Streptomyces sp. WMMC500]